MCEHEYNIVLLVLAGIIMYLFCIMFGFMSTQIHASTHIHIHTHFFQHTLACMPQPLGTIT